MKQHHGIHRTAIPCLNYKRALEEEAKAKKEAEERLAKGETMPKVEVQSTESEAAKVYTPEELEEYARRLFHFTTININTFK